MTHPIDTSPEAIAALLDGVTPGPWPMQTLKTSCGVCHKIGPWPHKWRGGKEMSACIYDDYPSPAEGTDTMIANARFIAAARELVPALAAEIARLTAAAENHNAAWVAACDRIAELEAERDALNEELREARMQAIADGVQFQLDMEDRAAERDEALIRAERSERAERAAHDAANTAIKQRDEVRALLAILYGEEGMGNVTPADASTALARRDAAMRNEGRRQAAKIAADYCFARTTNSGALKSPAVFTSHTWQDIRDTILSALEPEGGE